MRVHIGLLIVLLLLNLIPERKVRREKYILPLSFFLVLIYWAFRYDYGLDYWNYYNMFYTGTRVERTAGFGERWFYLFTHIFKYYYQSIIAQSIIIVVSLYHLVKKYISSKTYWLFFLLLFIVTGFHFNLISAQRSTMAAVIMYWGFDLFYISRKRWLPFIAIVFVASMFHTSAIVFLVLPIVEFLFKKASGRTLFVILVVSALLSHTITNIIFNNLVERITIFNDYSVYTDRNYTRSWSFILGSLLMVVPWYFLCLRLRTCGAKYDRIFYLAYLYQFLTLIALNFQERFTVYLYPFFIIILAQEVSLSDKRKRLIMLVPYIFYLSYALYWYYWMLLDKMTGEWSNGNMFFYHTIFEASPLP